MDDSDVFWHHFEEVEDPRIDRTKKHKLVDILFIASAAVIAGADSFVEIEMYGQRKYTWLQKFLEMPNPSSPLKNVIPYNKWSYYFLFTLRIW